MAPVRPWVRHELPWLRSGPIFRVHSQAITALDTFLADFNYIRIDLDGTRMNSRHDAHTEIERAFGFPEHYGKNWDAFNDCFRDFVEVHDGALIAIVWAKVEHMAAKAPATLAEVGWALVEAAVNFQPTLPPGDHSISMDVFMIGAGSDFDRP